MDIKKLFGEMDQLRGTMELVKKQIEQITITKETGAGLVQVTVSGGKKLLSVSIDETLLNKSDQKMVQDLIVGATNLALEEVDHKIQEMMEKHAGMA
ncbi:MULTISPECIES: YbaB/EbfC family nucleoid-associated protein [Candidatus Cardinium]|uniref:YbaB/EbfC family nucleoid-associated protein n=1 Tax=Candidatus Cardinium TaxID=273135 RepID=UPI001FAAFDA5|nr:MULTISPECIES: YbaB/EbfC family nucleoid-associated protein [Cardinium]